MKVNCTVVTVNYNSGPEIVNCVRSAAAAVSRVVVVDNASEDDSLQHMINLGLDNVTFVRNAENLGFAKACNAGAALARGEDIFFLNPDCELTWIAANRLASTLHTSPDIGMVGGLLLNPDGTEQQGGRRKMPRLGSAFAKAFGLRVLQKRYPSIFADFALEQAPLPTYPIEVEAISGACMLIASHAIRKVGLFDEEYFMHCEDLDLCKRMHDNGMKVLFVPDAEVLHVKGVSSRSRPIFVEWHKHRGMLRFFEKFQKDKVPLILGPIIWFGVWLRFLSIAARFYLQWLISKMIRSKQF